MKYAGDSGSLEIEVGPKLRMWYWWWWCIGFDTVIAKKKQRQRVCHILCVGCCFIGLVVPGILAYGKCSIFTFNTRYLRGLLLRVFFGDVQNNATLQSISMDTLFCVRGTCIYINRTHAEGQQEDQKRLRNNLIYNPCFINNWHHY